MADWGLQIRWELTTKVRRWKSTKHHHVEILAPTIAALENLKRKLGLLIERRHKMIIPTVQTLDHVSELRVLSLRFVIDHFLSRRRKRVFLLEIREPLEVILRLIHIFLCIV